jgi:DNA primase
MIQNTEQIKDKIDIVDFIGSYIKLDRSGINYKARCPFHNEKTPSFFVSPERQSFYCFGCGAKGDIFTFIERFEGLDFKESLKLLADKAGVELKNIESKQKPKQDNLINIMEMSTKFFENKLNKMVDVNTYLSERGLAPETVSKWRIGFAQKAWRDLHDHLLNSGFDKTDMLKTGMIKQSQDKYYDTFRGRIMFPIFDGNGKVIAFSGRIFEEEDGSPKYLNSPETELFKKSDVLYGWNFAKEAIRKLDYVVLVEGQFDLVLSHQASVPNTVASSGTALTTSHLKKIKRFTNRIIFAYDSDSAGEKAILRGAEIALILGMEVKVAEMPKGEDPASIIQSNPDRWRTTLRESKHIIDFFLDKHTRANTGTKLVKTIEKEILPLIKKMSSDIEKSHFIKKVAKQINVDEEAILKDLSKIKMEFVEEDETIVIKPTTAPEKILAGMIFGSGDDDIQNRWGSIISPEKVARILSELENEKEALIFGTEEYINRGKKEDIASELLNKFEIKELKLKLGNITKKLDVVETEEEKEKIRTEIDRITKRLETLFKIKIS